MCVYSFAAPGDKASLDITVSEALRKGKRDSKNSEKHTEKNPLRGKTNGFTELGKITRCGIFDGEVNGRRVEGEEECVSKCVKGKEGADRRASALAAT